MFRLLPARAGHYLHGGDEAEADEVFEQAGEGDEIVDGADGAIACAQVLC